MAADPMLPARMAGPRAAILSRSIDETLALGAALGRFLGDWITAEPTIRLVLLRLNGHLGAGKTHIAKGIVAGLGGDPVEVTSPTFTLEARHETELAEVVHVDAYRLAPEISGLTEDDPLFESGLDDAIRPPDATEPPRILLVEWADRFPGLDDRIADRVARIELEHGQIPDVRVIHLSGFPTAAIHSLGPFQP